MYTVMSVFCVFDLWLSFPHRAETTLTRGMWDSAVRFHCEGSPEEIGMEENWPKVLPSDTRGESYRPVGFL